MRTTYTKVLALILALVMTVSLLPMTVLADEPAASPAAAEEAPAAPSEESADPELTPAAAPAADPTVTIEDDILNTGCFTAHYTGAETDVTYQWSKRAASDGTFEVCTDRNVNGTPVVSGNSVNVALDDGARMWYKVSVLDSNKELLAESAAVQVPYASSIQNGSFEVPDIQSKNFTFIPTTTPGLEWKTSNNDSVEIATASNNPYGFRGGAKEGKQIAEINANGIGSLYQDILTVPGQTLTWTVYHAARNNTNNGAAGKDEMYVVVINASENFLDPNIAANMDAIIAAGGSIKKFSDGKDSAWHMQNDQYTVPENQYVTRLYFRSANKDVNQTYGNLIDNISLDKTTPVIGYPYTINYFINGNSVPDKCETGYQTDGQEVTPTYTDYYKDYIASASNPTDLTIRAGSSNVWNFYFNTVETVDYSWSGITGSTAGLGYLHAGTTVPYDSSYTPDATYTSDTTFANEYGTWTFSGWDKAAAFNVTADTTISGTWTLTTEKLYTLTYKITGSYYTNNSYYSEKVAYGTSLSPLTDDMAKSGYTFSGWSQLPAAMPAKDIVITGSYTQDHYNVYPDNKPTGDSTATIDTEVPTGLNGIDHIAYIIGRQGYARPESPITRAEVASIFFRLLTDEMRETYLTSESSFSDVHKGEWYNTMVDTLAEMGIINGYPDGTFRPNAYITRAEFAAIAARFDSTDITGKTATFSDIATSWAKDEIVRTTVLGWTNGYPDGTFRPQNNITRAEVATLVNRVLQRVPGKTEDLLADMVTWPDNLDTTKWYYLAIQEASNTHDYEKYTGDDKTTEYEKWTKLKENPDWTKYQK